MHFDGQWEPHGFSIFCDDVREEVSNKTIYIGVYNDVMQVLGDLPALLPTFAIVTHLFCEPTDTIDSLEVQVALPGEDLEQPSIKLEVDIEKLLVAPQAPPDNDELFRPRKHYVLKMAVNGLQLHAVGKIRVTVIWNGERVPVGSLAVAKELQ